MKGLPVGLSLDPGDIPSLEQLGFDASAVATAQLDAAGDGAVRLCGGEDHALRHLSNFLAQLRSGGGTGDSDAASSSGPSSSAEGAAPGAASRAASIFATQVSPWLAMGCLSPRHMYAELEKATNGAARRALNPTSTTSSSSSAWQQQQAGPGSGSAATAGAAGQQQQGRDGAGWLVLELLWRDFFRLTTHKYTSTSTTSTRKATAQGTAPPAAVTTAARTAGAPTAAPAFAVA